MNVRRDTPHPSRRFAAIHPLPQGERDISVLLFTSHPSTNPSPRLTCDAVPPRILKISAEPATLLPDRFQKWFAARGWSPREHQLALLEKAREDRSALLIAPTGAGKTLAGFLPTLVELSSGPAAPAKSIISTGPRVQRSGGLHTPHISPPKALARRLP